MCSWWFIVILWWFLVTFWWSMVIWIDLQHDDVFSNRFLTPCFGIRSQCFMHKARPFFPVSAANDWHAMIPVYQSTNFRTQHKILSGKSRLFQVMPCTPRNVQVLVMTCRWVQQTRVAKVLQWSLQRNQLPGSKCKKNPKTQDLQKKSHSWVNPTISNHFNT